MKTSQATRAREAAGLTPAEAAKRARIGVAYLRRIELHGKAPAYTAERLARVYDCSIWLFI